MVAELDVGVETDEVEVSAEPDVVVREIDVVVPDDPELAVFVPLLPPPPLF